MIDAVAIVCLTAIVLYAMRLYETRGQRDFETRATELADRVATVSGRLSALSDVVGVQTKMLCTSEQRLDKHEAQIQGLQSRAGR